MPHFTFDSETIPFVEPDDLLHAEVRAIERWYAKDFTDLSKTEATVSCLAVSVKRRRLTSFRLEDADSWSNGQVIAMLDEVGRTSPKTEPEPPAADDEPGELLTPTNAVAEQ